MNSQQNRVLFIRGDLNALQDGFIPLRNKIWINLIKEHYGPIHDGLKIWLYEKTEHAGKLDPTIFPGTIKDIGKGDEYKIEVDENDMQYLSESQQFVDYSIDDVLKGEKSF